MPPSRILNVPNIWVPPAGLCSPKYKNSKETSEKLPVHSIPHPFVSKRALRVDFHLKRLSFFSFQVAKNKIKSRPSLWESIGSHRNRILRPLLHVGIFLSSQTVFFPIALTSGSRITLARSSSQPTQFSHFPYICIRKVIAILFRLWLCLLSQTFLSSCKYWTHPATSYKGGLILTLIAHVAGIQSVT